MDKGRGMGSGCEDKEEELGGIGSRVGEAETNDEDMGIGIVVMGIGEGMGVGGAEEVMSEGVGVVVKVRAVSLGRVTNEDKEDCI